MLVLSRFRGQRINIHIGKDPKLAKVKKQLENLTNELESRSVEIPRDPINEIGNLINELSGQTIGVTLVRVGELKSRLGFNGTTEIPVVRAELEGNDG